MVKGLIMKIVLNKEYGGFGLSPEQAKAYGIDPSLAPQEIGGYKWFDCKPDGTPFERTDPKLIEVVEQGLPNAFASKLVVVEIPENVQYHITEYDGWETLVWSTAPINFI